MAIEVCSLATVDFDHTSRVHPPTNVSEDYDVVTISKNGIPEKKETAARALTVRQLCSVTGQIIAHRKRKHKQPAALS